MEIRKYAYITLLLIISTLFLSCKEETTGVVESDETNESSSSLEVIADGESSSSVEIIADGESSSSSEVIADGESSSSSEIIADGESSSSVEVIPDIEFSYEEVTNPTTGRVWMDRNLGATRVATSSTDSLAYGDLYQWGRATDGHEKRNSDTTSTLSDSDNPGHGKFILDVYSDDSDWLSPQNNNLWKEVDGINNPCHSGYRLPTKVEWEEEMATWQSQDDDGAFASPLKLSMAGNRLSFNGSILDVGSYGTYWSGTVDGIYASVLSFIVDKEANMGGMQPRAFGRSVRCIKN